MSKCGISVRGIACDVGRVVGVRPTEPGSFTGLWTGLPLSVLPIGNDTRHGGNKLHHNIHFTVNL